MGYPPQIARGPLFSAPEDGDDLCRMISIGRLPRIIREVNVSKGIWIVGFLWALGACADASSDTPVNAPTPDVVNDDTSARVDALTDILVPEDGAAADVTADDVEAETSSTADVTADVAAETSEEDAPVSTDASAPDAGPSPEDAGSADVTEAPETSASPSCAGKCGEYDPEAACQCNPACFTFGDCCADVCDACGLDFADECGGCTPDCTGVSCGDDGCGGSCGTCESGFECVSGQCSGPSCDGFCGVFDPARPCQCDAGCEDREDCCPDRCFFCGTDAASDCWCDSTCEVYSCGPEPCGNFCGTCEADAYCSDGECVVDSVCDGVGVQGCCDGDTLVMCDQGVFSQTNCAADGLACGWTGLWYDCGGLGAEPSGSYPLSCGDI
jgi:hypothetical protein